MKPFCEIVVQVVIPALRALLAKDLMKEHGLTQQETAKKLAVTQAAISQYQSDLRGYKVKTLEKNEKVMNEIKRLAFDLVKKDLNKIDASIRLCEICKIIRKEKLICALHKEACSSLENCEICSTGSPC